MKNIASLLLVALFCMSTLCVAQDPVAESSIFRGQDVFLSDEQESEEIESPFSVGLVPSENEVGAVVMLDVLKAVQNENVRQAFRNVSTEFAKANPIMKIPVGLFKGVQAILTPPAEFVKEGYNYATDSPFNAVKAGAVAYLVGAGVTGKLDDHADSIVDYVSGRGGSDDSVPPEPKPVVEVPDNGLPAFVASNGGEITARNIQPGDANFIADSGKITADFADGGR